MKTKKCSKCNKEKSLSAFYKNKLAPDGYRYKCKKCASKYYKKWREKNKEKVKKLYKKWAKNHPKKIKEYSRKSSLKWIKNNLEKYKKNNHKWKKENKEKMKEYSKKWYQNNKEYTKKYYQKNKEKILKQSKKWRKENPEKFKAMRKKWIKNNREYYNELMLKAHYKRQTDLAWNKLFENPFPDKEICWHHIDNKNVVAIPKEIHEQYSGYDRKLHRKILKPIVNQIYGKNINNI